MRLPAIESPALSHVRHAFFTRAGGVSEGVYASLNGGVGSNDHPDLIVENRRRMMLHLGAETLLVPYQIHSAVCLTVSEPWTERPRADALATRTPGLALGVTGADCGMVLFADRKKRVVGAAHAGWKGALDGILNATLDAMEELGAKREATVAVLGPTIGGKNYETGPEFIARFVEREQSYKRFFVPASRPDHYMFDLQSFIEHRLRAAGIGIFKSLNLDTYQDEARFFSFRRKTHRGEPDYGRQVSAIVL